jgi:aminoglycoside N3'-acetyltransferase
MEIKQEINYEVAQIQDPVTKSQIQAQFSFLKDKTIMLHTSYKAFGGVEGGPGAVVDAFAELCDTVLFPNFNFQSWTESHYWDYYETPSKMGIITEIARERFPRTFHPIYPFAVSCPDPESWQRCDGEEAFGLGSPWGFCKANFHSCALW